MSSNNNDWISTYDAVFFISVGTMLLVLWLAQNREASRFRSARGDTSD